MSIKTGMETIFDTARDFDELCEMADQYQHGLWHTIEQEENERAEKQLESINESIREHQIDEVIRLAKEYMCDLWNCGIKFYNRSTYNATYERAMRKFAKKYGIEFDYSKVIQRETLNHRNVPTSI